MEAEQDILAKIADRLSKLRNFTDTSRVDGLISRLLMTKDEDIKKFLMVNILKEYQRLELNFPGVDDSYPIIKNKEGFEVGSLVYNGQSIGRFSLSLEDINRNILIIGSTGHGKTSFILKILEEADKNGIRYLVFDMKRDYSMLGMAEDTVYISMENLKINPLGPPEGIPEKEWAVHFADIFSDSFALLIGSRDYLLENTVDLLSKWDKKFSPSLKDLLQHLNTSGRRNDYYKVVQGRINGLLMSSSVFDCNEGISFDDMKDKNIVMSMENFGTAESHFLVSFILSCFYYSNLNQRKDGEFKRLFVIDDAHSILDANQEKDYAKGIPTLHSIISKIREFGFGFIFSDQQISSILSSALQNTNTKFIGKVNLLQDLPKIFPAEYKLVPEIEKLGKGEFILLNESVSPFCLFKADFFKADKEVDWSLLKLKENLDRKFFHFFKADESDPKTEEFLKELDRNPAFNLSMHCSNLSGMMDREEFDNIKKKLSKDGIISEIRLLVDSGKIHKFLFISKAVTPTPSSLKVFDEGSFFKRVLMELVSRHLTAKNIKYQEEDSGVLINGLVKTYIFMSQDIKTLLKILETSFGRVIFIVKDDMKEEDVFADIIKTGETNSLINMKSLKIIHFSDFRQLF